MKLHDFILPAGLLSLLGMSSCSPEPSERPPLLETSSGTASPEEVSSINLRQFERISGRVIDIKYNGVKGWKMLPGGVVTNTHFEKYAILLVNDSEGRDQKIVVFPGIEEGLPYWDKFDVNNERVKVKGLAYHTIPGGRLDEYAALAPFLGFVGIVNPRRIEADGLEVLVGYSTHQPEPAYERVTQRLEGEIVDVENFEVKNLAQYLASVEARDTSVKPSREFIYTILTVENPEGTQKRVLTVDSQLAAARPALQSPRTLGDGISLSVVPVVHDIYSGNRMIDNERAFLMNLFQWSGGDYHTELRLDGIDVATFRLDYKQFL